MGTEPCQGPQTKAPTCGPTTGVDETAETGGKDLKLEFR